MEATVHWHQLTFSVHGYSNWWLKPFVVHQTFDRHIFQQPWLDGQRTDDQSGPITLWELCGHRWAHGAVISLHVPHNLCWGTRHRGAVGLDHTWRGGLVAHLGFGQHWGKQRERARTTITTHWCTFTHMLHIGQVHWNEQYIFPSSFVPLFWVWNADAWKLWKSYRIVIKHSELSKVCCQWQTYETHYFNLQIELNSNVSKVCLFTSLLPGKNLEAFGSVMVCEFLHT